MGRENDCGLVIEFNFSIGKDWWSCKSSHFDKPYNKGKSIQFNNAWFGLQNRPMAYEYGRRLSGVFETKRG